MANEEDKNRAAEYMGHGPVIVCDRGALLALRKRVETLEAQVKSLQVSAPKGIPKP